MCRLREHREAGSLRLQRIGGARLILDGTVAGARGEVGRSRRPGRAVRGDAGRIAALGVARAGPRCPVAVCRCRFASRLASMALQISLPGMVGAPAISPDGDGRVRDFSRGRLWRDPLVRSSRREPSSS